MNLTKPLEDILSAVLREARTKTGHVRSEWANDDHTLIVMRFTEDWGYGAAYWELTKIGYWINGAGHPVDLIFDLTQSGRFPRVLWMSMRMPYLWNRRMWPKRLHRMVVVGGGKEMREVIEMRQRIAPETMQYFRSVETMEQALETLETWDLPLY